LVVFSGRFSGSFFGQGFPMMDGGTKSNFRIQGRVAEKLSTICLRIPPRVVIVRRANQEVRLSAADQPCQEVVMRELRFELSVGDSLRVDDQVLTVMDIIGDEITFRVDFADELESESVLCASDIDKRFRPR
jgi:hypothetical protein